MKFKINYSKIRCELELNTKENHLALEEFRKFFEQKFQLAAPNKANVRMLKANVGENGNENDDISLIHISQYFDLQRIAQWLGSNNNNDPGCQVDGILLARLVKVINKRKIFGQNNNDVNFDKFIFEIYDNFFEDYCVLTNPNYPIPAESTIRIKHNNIKDDFTYPMVDGRAPVTKMVRFEDKVQLFGNDLLKKKRLRVALAAQQESYLGLQEHDITLARAMIELLYQNRSIYDWAQERIKKCNTLNAKRIGQFIWYRVRKELDNQNHGQGGETSMTTERCQTLFHEIVCRRYLDMLKMMNGLYSRACQTYVLFNTIHARIVRILARVEMLDPEYEINYGRTENYLCPPEFKCRVTLEKIKLARERFRKKYDENLNVKQ